jgi:hypothetical protein
VQSAIHRIFFPPRLEAVVQQQNPDRLSLHPWNRLPLDRLLSRTVQRA